MTGTVCRPCWLAWDPDREKNLRDHPPRKCRVEWAEGGKLYVCMCSCARAPEVASARSTPTAETPTAEAPSD